MACRAVVFSDVFAVWPAMLLISVVFAVWPAVLLYSVTVLTHNSYFGAQMFKGLRLVMWSLLHDTDQLREMLSADQSLRDRRSRGLWSVLSISRG